MFCFHDQCVGIPEEFTFDGRILKGYLESDTKQCNATNRGQMVPEKE